jgi:uncharacterized protein with GYD domain
MSLSKSVLSVPGASWLYGLALGLVLLVGLAPGTAEACKCMRQTPERAAAAADAVFLGKVVKLTPVNGRFEVVLEVEKWWRGAGGRQAVVFTRTNGALCGFSFAVGETYLVYGSRDVEKADSYYTGLCSRTKSSSSKEFEEDLRVLEKLTPPESDRPVTD